MWKAVVVVEVSVRLYLCVCVCGLKNDSICLGDGKWAVNVVKVMMGGRKFDGIKEK